MRCPPPHTNVYTSLLPTYHSIHKHLLIFAHHLPPKPSITFPLYATTTTGAVSQQGVPGIQPRHSQNTSARQVETALQEAGDIQQVRECVWVSVWSGVEWSRGGWSAVWVVFLFIFFRSVLLFLFFSSSFLLLFFSSSSLLLFFFSSSFLLFFSSSSFLLFFHFILSYV
jgi:hypothetical protein